MCDLEEWVLAEGVVVQGLLKSIQDDWARRVDVVLEAGDVVEDDPAEFHPCSCWQNFVDILPLPVLDEVPDHNSVVTIDGLWKVKS